MKKLFFTLMLTFLIGILTACSIPIGDGVLIVSSDRIDFIKDDVNENPNDEAVDVNSGEGGPSTTPDVNEEEFGDDDGAMPEGVNAEDFDPASENSNSASANNCEKQDHSAILNDIGGDFYIPECAIVTKQDFSDRKTTAGLDLPDANWQEVAEEYKAFFSDKDINEQVDFNSKVAQLRFKYDEQYSMSSTIKVEQKEDGIVYISLNVYKY